MTRTYIILLSLVSILYSCQSGGDISFVRLQPANFLLPTQQNAQYPWLHTDFSGSILMSWTEQLDSITSRLQYSEYRNGAWDSISSIAQGRDWFVNWADYPAIMRTADGRLVAHWLAKRAEGTYDYDVKISQRPKDSATWAEPITPHTDGVAAEHGFVSMLSMPDATTLAVWLDGRNTKMGGDGHEHHEGHGGGPMTLRAAQFDANGTLSNEVELDAKVCDCCQTSAAMTDKGPVVVYRDRTDKEIRDISIVRFVDGSWTSPQPVFEDDWEIKGCPVNGPKVIAQGNNVVVAWFTGVGGKPSVYAIHSTDAGETFGKPITVSQASPVGRLGLSWGKTGQCWLSWLEPSGSAENVDIKLVSIVLAEMSIQKAYIVAQVSASRASGVPQIAQMGHGLVMAWTEPGESSTIRAVMIEE